jgi:hypothetical protein
MQSKLLLTAVFAGLIFGVPYAQAQRAKPRKFYFRGRGTLHHSVPRYGAGPGGPVPGGTRGGTHAAQRAPGFA